jgi:hypothetical protein
VPSDDIGDAGEKTKAAGTVRVETVVRASVVGQATEAFELRSTGVIDYATDRSEYREESSGCRTIVIGDVSYGEVPADAGFPPGKRWVKSGGEDDDAGEAPLEQSRTDTVESSGGMSTYTISFATSDPSTNDYLDDLRRSSHEPERVGQEDVRGVSTTHYRGEVDVQSRIESSLEGIEDIEEAREIDVWIDSEGRARRVVATDEPSDFEEGVGGWIATTEYFDFGVEVEIQAPPATEVLEPEEWMRMTEERMQEQMQAELDALRVEAEEGVAPLPGAFVPSEQSDSDSAEASCLH